MRVADRWGKYRALRVWGVLAFFTGLTVIVTNPLSFHAGDHLRDVGDSYEYAWAIGFAAYQLLHQPLRLYDGNIFYPFPLSLAYSDSSVPSLIIGAPIVWLSDNPILAHNIVLLLTFILGGMGMTLLVHERTRSPWAAILAGAAYAFSPYRFDHLAQIPNVSMQWAPFALWCFERYLASGRYRWAAGFTLCTMLQILVSFYYAFILGLGIAIYVLTRLIGPDRSWLRPGWILPLLGFSFASGLVATPFILPYFTVEHTFAMHRTITEAISFSAWPTNYLASTPTLQFSLIAPLTQLVLNRWPDVTLGSSERHLYPGLAVVLLALIAVARSRSRALGPLLMICAGLILSFGPVLHLIQHRAVELPFPMLYAILYDHLPGFTALRVPSRFAALVVLGLAILGGDGILALQDRIRAGRGSSRRSMIYRALIPISTALVLLEGITWLPTSPVKVGAEVPPVYRWLATQSEAVPAPSPVIELPIDDNAFHQSPRSYYSTYHHQPLINGFRSFVPAAYQQLLPDLATFPSERAIDTIGQLGVRYIVVHQAEYSEAEQSKISQVPSDLHLAAQFGDDRVYEVTAPPNPPALLLRVAPPACFVAPGAPSHLQVTLLRATGRGPLIFPMGTRELTFQLHWEARKGDGFDEIIRFPIATSVVPAPFTLDLPFRFPPHPEASSLTVTLTSLAGDPVQASAPWRGMISPPPAESVDPRVPWLIGGEIPATRLPMGTGPDYLSYWAIPAHPARPLVAFVNAYDDQNRYWSYPSGKETRFGKEPACSGAVEIGSARLLLNPDTPPGHYTVEIGLLDPATQERVPFIGPEGRVVTQFILGSFWILPPHAFGAGSIAPTSAVPHLLGEWFSLEDSRVVPSSSAERGLQISLRWGSRKATAIDYTAFVHVTDASGHLVAQLDGQPTGGVYPTSAWQPGDTVVDAVTLQLPAELRPGSYQIRVGLYDLKTLQRLPVSDPTGKPEGDTILVDTIGG